jgi:hypothetical protein
MGELIEQNDHQMSREKLPIAIEYYAEGDVLIINEWTE